VASGLKNILVIQKMIENGKLNSNTLLIIDEPEVNLHPEWQVKFAEIIVLMNLKMKVRTILNTHSPYFMRAIESKMAEHEIADKAKYYYMNNANNGEYSAEDVTDRTEIVYSTMYKPLEEL
jgi:predicted ATPase